MTKKIFIYLSSGDNPMKKNAFGQSPTTIAQDVLNNDPDTQLYFFEKRAPVSALFLYSSSLGVNLHYSLDQPVGFSQDIIRKDNMYYNDLIKEDYDYKDEIKAKQTYQAIHNIIAENKNANIIICEGRGNNYISNVFAKLYDNFNKEKGITFIEHCSCCSSSLITGCKPNADKYSGILEKDLDYSASPITKEDLAKIITEKLNMKGTLIEIEPIPSKDLVKQKISSWNENDISKMRSIMINGSDEPIITANGKEVSNESTYNNEGYSKLRYDNINKMLLKVKTDTIISCEQIEQCDKKIELLMNCLSEYYDQNKDLKEKNGHNFAFHNIRDKDQFGKILHHEMTQKSILIDKKDLMKELNHISKTLQEKSKDIFGTIEGKNYKNHKGADCSSSWRMAVLHGYLKRADNGQKL